MIALNFEEGPLNNIGKLQPEEVKTYMELTSLQFGVGRGISMSVGGGKERTASVPSFSEITVTREADEASSIVFQESVRGKGVEVIIKFIQLDDAGVPEVHSHIELTDALISSYSASAGSDGKISESWSISFTKIMYGFAGREDDGTLGDMVDVTYNLLEATTE